MKKEFSLQNFKSSASNASDFLKSKGHNIPRSTMLNALSIFIGLKNWNTAQGILSKSNQKQDLLNLTSGLVLISSSDQHKILNYIHEKMCFELFNKKQNKKILRVKSFDDHYEKMNFNIYNDPKNNNELILSDRLDGPKTCISLSFFPDVLIIDLLDEDQKVNELKYVSLRSKMVFLGVNVKHGNTAKDELFKSLMKDNDVRMDDVLSLERCIKGVIDLD